MIRYQAEGGIAEVLLDYPPVNAITDELLDEMMAVLHQAGADPAVRAVILGSAVPGRFCGGLDLRKFRKRSPAEVHAIVNKLLLRVVRAAG